MVQVRRTPKWISAQKKQVNYDSGKETSEDIVSDAAIDMYAEKQAIISELGEQGWQSSEIEQWSNW